MLEKFSRNRILKRRLPKRAGNQVLYVSPDSALSYWKHNLEQKHGNLIGWAQEFVKPGMNVWDVGANVGVFTYSAAYFAGIKGHVIGIEADTFLAHLLHRSSLLPYRTRSAVTILPAAISNEIGVADFIVASRGRSSNHLASVNGNEMAGGNRHEMTVMTVTLDFLADRYPPPDVIKIDVEGAESKVLEGGRHLLMTCHPLLLCEVNSENTDIVSKFLTKAGYEMFDLDDRNRGPIKMAAFNTLAIHSQKGL